MMRKYSKEEIMAFLRKKEVISGLTFLVAALFAYYMTTYTHPYLEKVTYVVLAIELVILVSVTWGMAVHAVVKSLFGVGAGLSLVIYLAQSYCEVPNLNHSADDALKSLIAFSLMYIGIEFVWSLYKEAKERVKNLTEVNKQKRPWIALVPFGIFTGLFTWQVLQVLIPIINALCVYRV